MSTSSKARIGKIPVDRISLDDLLLNLKNAIRSRTPKTVFYANSYAVTLAEEDPAFAAATVPIGKAGQAEDIANGVLFLCSDASSHMTGSELVIDGGMTAGRVGQLGR